MTIDQRTVLITGATSGLGSDIAARLAARGATLLLHGRDPDRLHALCQDLGERGATAYPYVADLAALDEVRDLGRRLVADWPRLDVLVNNAGVGPGSPGATRQLNRDGHELRFAVNYLAPYALTRQLLPALRRSAAARVVNVGSAAQADLDLDDLMMAGGYDGWLAYGRAKLALASFSVDLAEELASDGITVNCLHPADLMPTPMVRETGLRPMSTIEQGTEAVLRLVCDPVAETGSGAYHHGPNRAEPHADVRDPEKRRLLREATERILAGQPV
ncbi:SDR family NAD(P)-dependent oxidoreductase [Streptomyces sp. NPDC127098]|uniref:SDR family NAD(P)-dependent oxidoreductase n=1 Tax=Streptomyces sp. NPDC127098 TaxID=3347137 RepID=UPI0036497CBF